jgi:hypothetical protein
MSFKIIPIRLTKDQKYDPGTSSLILEKGGYFTFKIQTTEIKNLESKIKSNNDLSQKEYEKSKKNYLKWEAAGWNDKSRAENKAQNDFRTKLDERLNKENTSLIAQKDKAIKSLATLNWCWQLASKKGSNKLSQNELLTERIQETLTTGLNEISIKFPDFLEGGGTAWLEPYENEKQPTGIPSAGLFVQATGIPKIIAAEWKDKDENKIEEKIAFGSTVYLHIYTAGLYDENIEVQLRDTNLANSDLTPTPADADGQPVQQLNPNALKRFTRKVDAIKYDGKTKPQSMPPDGAKTGHLGSNKSKKNDPIILESNVQKCVFPVFIEQAWMYQGSGNFDSGEELSINPIIYHPKIKEEQDLDDVVLNISKDEGKLLKGELQGNNPLMVGEVEKSGVPDKKKVVNFIFGVFLDGTLNNLYNSEARQNFEAKHGVANSQSDVEKHNEEKYRYDDESSYENDLSNPAIIYKNYIEDTKNENNPVFKIYTEGIGTTTKPNENGQLNVEDYDDDDMVGYGLGTTAIYNNTGIKKKVRQACEEMAKKITEFISKKPGYIIGTITVDVFGFSRGAAAARNFVHEITYPSYDASPGIEKYRCDQHGYPVAAKYWENTRLPSNGHLGYMLTESNLTFQKLDIRFAGIYDTVPHHGLSQANDANDLGLHNINKANYVVHMVAADEHRKNFSLVGISSVSKTPPQSGKKGGIELYFPGVHCDVGGSYVDEKPEKKIRIDASDDYFELKKLKEELIAQGWFSNKQVYILNALSQLGGFKDRIDDSNYNNWSKYILNSDRAAVSNQYSFIPLHLMVDFCEMKKVMINKDTIHRIYKFTNKMHVKGNIEFLNRIKERLRAYSFEGAPRFDYVPAEKFHQPDIIYDPKDAKKVIKEYNQRQIEGQNKLDEIAKEKNADIMFLRKNYLHWNSVYGQDTIDIVVQPHAPNIKNGKRTRTIR